jgi:hypothetical protein
VRVVPGADLTFSGGTTVDGGVVLEGRGGDLVFRKKVMPEGSVFLEVEAFKDAFTVGFAADQLTVRRARRSVTVHLATGSEDELAAAGRLLAGSRAVRLFRAAASAIQEAEDDSPAAVALITSDALIGMVTGDAGAPGRAARHLARRGRARVRNAGLGADCYREWEQRVLTASYDWESCARDFAVWNPIRNLCAARWVLAVESYWFTFISCSGIGAL